MKILIFSQYFWPETFVINPMAARLVQMGHEVTVLTGKPNYPEGRFFAGYRGAGVQREEYQGAKLVRLPMVARAKGGLRLAVNYLSFMVSAAILAPIQLRKTQFDVVFVYALSPMLQALPALLLARLYRKPLVIWVQDLWPESLSATGYVTNKTALSVVERLVRLIYARSDGILIQSHAFAPKVIALGGAARKIHYFPNPFIAETSDAPDPRAQALAREIGTGFSVVFAGNLGAAQGLDTVLDAAAMCQAQGLEMRLFLVGSGSQSAWLAEQVAARDLRNVVLPGRFAPTEVGAIIESAGALLVSLRDEPIFADTVPSKVQHYMAAGRPIIAALNGEGARIVLQAGAGLAAPAGDAQALAAAITRIAQMPEGDRRQMGENGQAFAQAHFTLDRLTEDLIAYFTDLTARPTAPDTKVTP